MDTLAMSVMIATLDYTLVVWMVLVVNDKIISNTFKGKCLIVRLMRIVVLFMDVVALSSILSRNVSNKVVYNG